MVALLALLVACAHLQPGADPLVVRTEQTEQVALATMNLAVHLDDANRTFYRSNAAPFHVFCEWLRQPQTVLLSPTGNVTLARGPAMLWSLHQTKLAYQSSKTYSNALVSALATVEAALAEAQQWVSQINTNAP